MRNFLIKLFETREEPFDIELFSFWHILYLVLIIGSIITAGVLLRGSTPEKKMRVLAFLSTALVVIYLGDFFIQPLFRDGEMNVDKLPFHICTLMCPVSAFVQFNKKFERFREPVAFLSIVAPLMYLTYPGTAIGSVSPFCYEIIQTFLFHGVLLAWGYLNIALGVVKPVFKHCYRALIGIVMVAAWAFLGNCIYGVPYNYTDADPHFDWFFLTGSTFPFVPKALMPFAVITAVFLMVLIIYGLYFLVMHIAAKKAAPAEEKETVEV